jgi:RNA binding exosome subunit
MSIKRPVRYVELTTLVHATEDKEKVLRAIHNLFPDNIDPPRILETNLTGFFGDDLTSIKLEITKRKPATEFLEYLILNLNSIEYQEILDNLSQRMDDSKNLYLRFDKQKAFQGNLSLDMHDSIRIKFRLEVPWGRDPVEVITEYLSQLSTGSG